VLKGDYYFERKPEILKQLLKIT